MAKLAKKELMKKYSISGSAMNKIKVEANETQQSNKEKDNFTKKYAESLSKKEFAEKYAKLPNEIGVYFYPKDYSKHSVNEVFYASVFQQKRKVTKTLKNAELKSLGYELSFKKAKPTKNDIRRAKAIKVAKSRIS